MVRSDLIEALALRFSGASHTTTFQDSDLIVRCILETMVQALLSGKRVEIRGFGSFSAHHRAARLGRNPRSQEAVSIPQKRVARFKMGRALREAMGMDIDAGRSTDANAGRDSEED